MTGGSSGGGNQGPQVVKTKVPEETQSLNFAMSVLQGLLGSTGGMTTVPGQQSQLATQIADLQSKLTGAVDTQSVNKEISGLQKQINQQQKRGGTADPALVQQLADAQAKLATAVDTQSLQSQIADLQQQQQDLQRSGQGLDTWSFAPPTPTTPGQFTQPPALANVVTAPTPGGTITEPTGAAGRGERAVAQPLTGVTGAGGLPLPNVYGINDPEQLAAELAFQKNLSGLTNQTLLDAMSGKIPQTAQDLVSAAYKPQFDMANQALMRLGVELAGKQGMGTYDTPVAGPIAREGANMFSQLGGSAAGALLNQQNTTIAQAQAMREFQLGLNQLQGFTNPQYLQEWQQSLTKYQQDLAQQNQFTNPLTLAQFQSGLQQWQDQLSQLQGFTNPFNLAQGATNLGLGLYTPRFRVGTAQTPVGGGTLSAIGAGLSGLGQVASSPLGQAVGSGLAGLAGGLFGGGATAGGIFGGLAGGTAAALGGGAATTAGVGAINALGPLMALSFL